MSDLAAWKRTTVVKKKRFSELASFKKKAMAVDDKLKEMERKKAAERKKKLDEEASAEVERMAKKYTTANPLFMTQVIHILCFQMKHVLEI